MRYMVMECHLSYAVVLDEEGRFLTVANRQYQVGMTVTDVIELQLPERSAAPARRHMPRGLYTMAAMAACLVLVAVAVLQMGTYRRAASVYMRINPAVRIDVNRNDLVIGLEGVNEDGKTLLTGYQFKKKTPLADIMNELADRAIDQGYLHPGGTIDILLEKDDEQWVAAKQSELNEALSKHLSEKMQVDIIIHGSNEAAGGEPSRTEPHTGDDDVSATTDSRAETSAAGVDPSSSADDDDDDDGDDDEKPSTVADDDDDDDDEPSATSDDNDDDGDDDDEPSTASDGDDGDDDEPSATSDDNDDDGDNDDEQPSASDDDDDNDDEQPTTSDDGEDDEPSATSDDDDDDEQPTTSNDDDDDNNDDDNDDNSDDDNDDNG